MFQTLKKEYDYFKSFFFFAQYEIKTHMPIYRQVK